MTVAQLIKVLIQIQDQETRVMVNGYEGGYSDIVITNSIDNNTPAIYEIALDVNKEWYYGAHEKVDDIDRDAIRQYKIVSAIIL